MQDIRLRNSILEDPTHVTLDVRYVATEGIIVGGLNPLNHALAVELCVEDCRIVWQIEKNI